MRPYLPPSLAAIAHGAEGAASRIAADQREFDSGFAAGRTQGMEASAALGRTEGFAAGKDAGHAMAVAEFAARERNGVDAANAALATLLARRAEDRQALDAEARAALSALLGILSPALLAGSIGAELTAMLAEALERRGTDSITVRAHPVTLAGLPPEGLQAPPGVLLLCPDPARPPGSAEIDWTGGGLVFDAEALLARLQAILGGAPPSTPLRSN